MRHLWQRIFTYAIVLVIVSQAAALFLHRYSVSRDEAQGFITEYTISLAASVEDSNATTADAILRIFNRKRNRAWIEDRSGGVIAGMIPNDIQAGAIVREIPDNGLIIREAENLDGWYVVSIPVSLEEGRAKLFMLFGPPRYPAMWTIFMQGLLFVSIIGLLLAFWMARRVSRPLRTLRDEVLVIAGGNLESRVSVEGHDEITDVAKAVNQMANSLAKHIRSMRELVANISHEMRSPLARVQVSLALLEEDIAKESKAANRLALIHEELAHMNKLIGATLLTSKLDLQSSAKPEGIVVFSGLCADACRRHTPFFNGTGIQFSNAIQEDINLYGDETLLTTLVSNLLDNAAKYTTPEGTVFLRLYTKSNEAILEVENCHNPLPDDVLDHLFEPFYRGGIATGNGVGLGLSLVRKIALLHGGDVTVQNIDGKIRFTTRFPLEKT